MVSSLLSLWPVLRPAVLGVGGIAGAVLVGAAFLSGLADSLSGAL